MKKIIQFELNEVPKRIVEDYVNNFPNSNLSKIYNNSKIYNTYSEDSGHLSPWITWPTVHRGVDNTKHSIGYFGQDLKEIDDEYPPIWKILTNNNIDVGLFGSLHSYPLPDLNKQYKFYVPDTFANGPECFPKNIEIFQKFNLKMVDLSSRNANAKIPLGETFSLIANYNKLGISQRTIFTSLSQLLNEKIIKHRVVRRRTLQAKLSFDIFFKNLSKYKPSFSTFFTNHVASAQHRYWLAKYPNDYSKIYYSNKWISDYKNEIDFAMNNVNYFLGKLIKFISKNKEYQLILSSSMGQEATENSSPITSQLYLTNFKKFLNFFDINPSYFLKKRSMLPQINFEILKNKDDLIQKLNKLKINNEKLKFEVVDNFFSITFGHENLLAEDIKVIYENQVINYKDLGLDNVIIQDAANTTAYHIPEGILLSYPNYAVDKNISNISTNNIAPSILNNFGLNAPNYMSKPIDLINNV